MLANIFDTAGKQKTYVQVVTLQFAVEVCRRAKWITVQTVQSSRQVNGFQCKQYDSIVGKALLNTLHY